MYQDLTIEAYQEQFINNGTGDYILLDVREVDEFVQARIPGAVNLPLSELQMRIDEVDDSLPIVLVCRTGVRSVMAAQFMAANGFPDLYNLLDGTMGWAERGLPLEAGE